MAALEVTSTGPSQGGARPARPSRASQRWSDAVLKTNTLLTVGQAGTSNFRRSTVKKAEPGTARELDLVMNLVTGGLGTGILCLPWLTAGASLVPGLIIILGVLIVNAWTISILVKAADRHQSFDFGNLLAQLPHGGAALQALSNAVVWVSTFGCLVGYIIVIANSCVELFGGAELSGAEPFRMIMVLSSALVVMPLCFLDQSKLAFTSVLTVVAFCYIFIVVVINLVTNGFAAGSCIVGIGTGSMAMLGGVANCIIVQMCILPMYGELADRTPAKMDRIVVRSFIVLFFLFASYSAIGYLVYGPGVEDNLMADIGGKGVWNKIAQFGVAVAVMGVYPILICPMLAPIKNSPDLQQYATVATICIVVASSVVAIPIQSLGSLSIINGAICAGIFVGALPALVGKIILGMPAWQMWSLAIGGALATIVGIAYMDNYVDELHCFIGGHSVVAGVTSATSTTTRSARPDSMLFVAQDVALFA